MRPLPPATWARLSSLASLPRTRPPRPLPARCFHKGPRDTVSKPLTSEEYGFEQLRLQRDIVEALHLAYPSVKHPTLVQRRFIHAVLGGKDVLLRDKTGTGKSFALALALLTQKAGPTYKHHVTGAQVPSITSLLLVPHRDLAYQFFHWIERIHHHMTHPPPLPSIAQILIRDSSAPLGEHLAPIQQTPPHILIGTPQAVFDAVQADPGALPLSRLSTVVVDEADYLIETVPKLPDKYAVKKLERLIKRHPGPTRLLLNRIYSTKEERPKDRPRWKKPREDDRRRDDTLRKAPQLVMMSATLRNHLKGYLLGDSGWFTKESGKLVRITGDPSAHHPKEVESSSFEDQANMTVGGTDIRHHVLVVSERGGIANIQGAVSAPTTSEHSRPSTPSPEEPTEMPAPVDVAQAPATGEEVDDPSPFNPSAMEAIATAFALDVPSVGMLVLPSHAPVHRAVYDLRLLGVNAHALDVVKDENGRMHLMRRDFESTSENPTLLVSTLASTRGLDLPELSHVFILGIVDGGAVDSYLHVAGRVGRFGRGGSVISVLADLHEVTEDGKRRRRDEPRMMGAMLKKMGISPVKLEHFE
ncbi:P-loop containing nucleoside triphosphate hydrolase protein [Ganoderma leucocontextum]|nr:P-loop containing nucleoside triphosphate hydrolase protein [Ganoderma leucocontextum]